MAQAKVLSSAKLIIQVGDGASPEVFAAPCGLTTRGFARSANVNETNVPDCDDEDAPAWLARDIVSLSSEISGSGVLDTDALDVWDTWFDSGVARNCRVVIDVPLAQNGRHYAGRYILSGFTINGERGSKIAVDVTMTSDGEVVKVDADA